MDDHDWQQWHRADLARRIAPLSALPDGTLNERDAGVHRIRVLKINRQIHCYFVGSNGALEGPMSRMAIDQPLALLAEYAQAAMLTLCWKPEPTHICLLGLAGGRLSLVLYHYFAHATIQNVDVDPAVVPIAEHYFGVTFDARQPLAIADARAFLGTSSASYDIVVLDAFSDDTDALNHLATTQFYEICQARLERGGVLCINMLKSDPLFRDKVKTFLHSFRFTLYVEQKHGLVLFGSQAVRLTPASLVQRARELQRQHNFEFPLLARAEAVQLPQNSRDYSTQALRDATILLDPPR